MTRKFGQILFLSLLAFAFLAGSAFTEDNNKLKNADLNSVIKTLKDHPTMPHDSYKTWPKDRLIGPNDDISGGSTGYFQDGPRDLGYDQRGIVLPGAAVGMTVGLTTYDYQHNCRSTRQVAWRGTNDVHIAWMKKNASNPTIGGNPRITAYQFFSGASTGVLKWSAATNFGGDDLHASTERSGYCGLEVMSDGRGMPYNHYDPDGLEPYDFYPVVWPDQTIGSGTWGYKQGVPELNRVADFAAGDKNWTWPYATFQLYDNGTGEDTIIHILAQESGAKSNQVTRYFRRTGGPHPDAPTNAWTHMTVDTGQTISTVVEAAPPEATGNEGKVALVWCAYFGASYPGDPESGLVEPISLALEQNAQDVYIMTSDDAGETWNGKYNVTKNNILTSGYWPLGDISAVIDTDGRLHIVWAARPHVNLTGVDGALTDPQMDYPLYPFGSRVLHWSDNGEALGPALNNNYISIVRDAMADWTEMDSICIGGAWHSMALNLPQIGQCDDKLYVSFAQYQDVANGIWDNCHMTAWTQNIVNGSANANLYFSVSPMANGGNNWDPARLLTDFTRRCDTAFTGVPGDPVDPNADNVCHSHFYNSMSRWGMDISGFPAGFTNAVVVKDPTWAQTESPNYYLDVFYVDDLWPGGLVQGEGMWAIDPIKWFRLPCVDAVEEAILAYSPSAILETTPSWTKPGVAEEVDIMLLNIGNIPLAISSITVTEVGNAEPSYNGWLTVNQRGFGGTITEVVPGNFFEIGVVVNTGGIVNETAVLNGVVTFNWGAGKVSTLPIGYIVADTVQQREQDTLFTQHIGITVANEGNYGGGLYDTCGRMDFHIIGNLGLECDTCQSGPGSAEYKYLADGSPFVVRDIGVGDYRISASMAGHSQYSEVFGSDPAIKDGFRSLEGQPAEYNATFCKYTESGTFVSADSSIGVINQMIAPFTNADTSDFFVLVTKYFNKTAASIPDIYVGTVEDWDVPSDTGSRNTSGYDADRKLMYMTGWEVSNADTFCSETPGDPNLQNNCTDADMRAGGSAFWSSHQYKGVGATKITNKGDEPQGAFTFKNANWIGGDVRSHIPAERLYDTLNGSFFGYSPWQATSGAAAESIYQDLAMITSFGQFDLGIGDTLTFVKFLASEYDGGLAGIQTTMDKARLFTLNYLCCDIWGLAGDANTDGKLDILDIVYLINFKYKLGPGVKWPSATYDPTGIPPTSNCNALMNTNSHLTGFGNIDILDIVYLINYKYKGGASPTCRYNFISRVRAYKDGFIGQGPYDNIDLTTATLALKAITLLPGQTPNYQWTPANPAVVTVSMGGGDHSSATITRVGTIGASTTITLSDETNNLNVVMKVTIK